MRTPQVPAMPEMSPLGLKPLNRHDRAVAKRIDVFFNPRNVDERTVAERKWRSPLKPGADQKPCDHGLFSDDSKQTSLF